MEENKKYYKISLSTFLVIILTVVIAIMGYFVYNISNERNNSNAQIAKLENEISTYLSFSELMNTLYVPIEFQENNINYTSRIEDSVSIDTVDIDRKIIRTNTTRVECLEDNSIIMHISDYSGYDAEKMKSEEYKITGIDEEVVCVEIKAKEAEATPEAIVFLTRNGNVYCLKGNFIENNDFVAQKISDLNGVIAVEHIDAIHEEAMDGKGTLMALKYDGTHEDMSEYLY